METIASKKAGKTARGASTNSKRRLKNTGSFNGATGQNNADLSVGTAGGISSTAA